MTESITEYQIRITGIRFIDVAPWENGFVLIARYDCEASGFSFVDCPLMIAPDRAVSIQLPKALIHGTQTRAVQFVDRHLRKRMRDAAVRAYEALGGDLDAIKSGMAPAPKAVVVETKPRRKQLAGCAQRANFHGKKSLAT